MQLRFLFTALVLAFMCIWMDHTQAEPDGLVTNDQSGQRAVDAVQAHERAVARIGQGLQSGLDKMKLGEEWGFLGNEPEVSYLNSPLDQSKIALYEKAVAIAPKVAQLIGLVGSGDRGALTKLGPINVGAILDSDEKIEQAMETAKLETLRLVFELGVTPSQPETPAPEAITPVNFVDEWWPWSNHHDLTIRIRRGMTDQQIFEAILKSLALPTTEPPPPPPAPRRTYSTPERVRP